MEDTPKENLKDKILKLKKDRNGVILAHNYQIAEVQDIADYVGDSLQLSRIAASEDAETIIFCGVYFMAETAAILSPEKTVLIPDKKAGCPMVDMAPLERVLNFIRPFPNAVIVTYVNSSAEVKAISDYCCTSANGVQIVESIGRDKDIIFLPDKNLGSYIAEKTRRNLLLYDGFCSTHANIREENILQAKKEHPNAEVMVHPECTPEVRKLADKILSTGGMCRNAGESSKDEFIAGTEKGIIHRLKKENPGKYFYPVTEDTICPNMKRINLEKILQSLEKMEHKVTVPEAIRSKALKAVTRMVELTGEGGK